MLRKDFDPSTHEVRRVVSAVSAHVADRMHCLWDELALMPASDPEAALNLLFDRVGAEIDSAHGFWLSALRLHDAAPQDPLKGWRARSIFFSNEMQSDAAAHKAAIKQFNGGTPDESSCNHVRQAGRFRSKRLVDHVSPEFFDSDFYRDHYLARGIFDRIFVVMPLNADVESYFIFDRLEGQKRFASRDLEIAQYALRSLGWFNRQLHLSYGELIAESALTTTERAVVRHVLAGRAEKQIARKLEHSPHTTHQYIKELFRKFDVRSRAELMALWLGH